MGSCVTSFAAVFVLSIAVAATSLAMGFIPGGRAFGFDTISASLLLSGFWLAMFLFTVVVYRLRGLWLLLGFPVAAAMPLLVIIWHFTPCPPGGCL
jgi:hypothetical protein